MSTLGVTKIIPIPDITDTLVDWTSLQVAYAPDGRAGTYSLLTTITLVADQTAYTFTHTTARPEYWYRWRLYNTSTTAATDWSEPEPAGSTPTTTLRRAIWIAADRLSCYVRPPRQHLFPGFSGVTTSDAANAFLVNCTWWKGDLLSFGGATTSTKMKGWWLRFYDGGAVAGETRRVVSHDTTSGVITVDAAFSAAPPAGASFELFTDPLAPERWDTAAMEALGHLWVEQEAFVTGITGRTEYPLPHYFENPSAITGVWRQTGTDALAPTFTSWSAWEARRGLTGGVVLHTTLSDNQVLRVGGKRRNYVPLSLDEVLPLQDDQLEQVVVGTQLTAARLIYLEPGDYRTYKGMWKERFGVLEAQWRRIIKQSSQFRAVNFPHEERV